jgi:hypothetical protein
MTENAGWSAPGTSLELLSTGPSGNSNLSCGGAPLPRLDLPLVFQIFGDGGFLIGKILLQISTSFQTLMLSRESVLLFDKKASDERGVTGESNLRQPLAEEGHVLVVRKVAQLDPGRSSNVVNFVGVGVERHDDLCNSLQLSTCVTKLFFVFVPRLNVLVH